MVKVELKLREKKVFISGSTTGIGFCTAKLFLQEGASVIINGRDSARVNNAVEELRRAFPHSDVQGKMADFLDPESVRVLIETLPDIDILINNVGIYASKSFFDTTDKDWEDQLTVNLISGVRLSRHLLPKMLKNNWGRIVFISSECATLVPVDLIAYSTTKAAVLALSRGLAQLTKGSGVTVNSILPGSTATAGAENFIASLAKKENKTKSQAEADFFKNVRSSSLLQRFATEEEIANTIVYFASPLAPATNGAAIKVDGGSIGGII